MSEVCQGIPNERCSNVYLILTLVELHLVHGTHDHIQVKAENTCIHLLDIKHSS